MGGDDSDAAFEWQGQNARIGEFAADNGQCVFTAGMSQQRQLGFGHVFPKAGETRIGAIDILAIRQALHHHRA